MVSSEMKQMICYIESSVAIGENGLLGKFCNFLEKRLGA